MESPRLTATSVALRATAITAALLLGSSLLHSPESAHASPDENEQHLSLLEHAEDYFQENPPALPQEEVPDFGPGDRAVSAWDSDEITTDEMVRYGFLTAFSPDELPSEYQPDDDADLDLDFYVPYVLSHLDEASEETRAWVEERTTPQMPEEVRDGVLESQKAADDCGDGETVDDYFFACGTTGSQPTSSDRAPAPTTSTPTSGTGPSSTVRNRRPRSSIPARAPRATTTTGSTGTTTPCGDGPSRTPTTPSAGT